MSNNKFSVDIPYAVQILQNGGLVAMPTETVYGLGADASNEKALHQIFAAKERPYNHPLIVHIASVEQLSDWAIDIPPVALELATAFWPGPLTLILKRQPHVLDVVTGGQETVGLRVPSHPVAQMLLQAFKCGIAAPSANKFTHISPTTAAAVYEELGEEVDLILEGGDCEVGLESTILDLTQDAPIILRPGMITAEQIAAVLKRPVSSKQSTSVVRAPGMHHLHYAPTTETVLMSAAEIAAFMQQLSKEQQTSESNASERLAQIPELTTEEGAFVDLMLGAPLENEKTQHLLNIELPVAIVTYQATTLVDSEDVQICQMSADAGQYAHDIYHILRTLDNQHLKCIIIEMVPDTSEWDAIRDRLTKAAARKSS